MKRHSDLVYGLVGWCIIVGLIIFIRASDNPGEWRQIGGLFAVAVGVIVTLGVIGAISNKVGPYILRCPHGVFGGQSRNRCGTCIEWAHKQELQNQKIRNEQLRREVIRKQAETLHQSEREKIRRRLLRNETYLLSMKPQEFENLIADIFQKRGYSVKQTPYVNDRGRDAILLKEGQKYVMECKRYDKTKNAIGRRSLQILRAAMLEERCKNGIFVTTGRFASTAEEYAQVNNIQLIDGPALLKLIDQTIPSPQSDYKVRVMCLSCGETVLFSTLEPNSVKPCRNGHSVDSSALS